MIHNRIVSLAAFRMYLVFIACTVLCMFQTVSLIAEEPIPDKNNTATNQIQRKLRFLVIDKVDFNKIDISVVLDFLTKKSKKIDPDHVGIKFDLRLSPTNLPSEKINRSVTLRLEKAPFDEVLGFIWAQTGLIAKIEKGIVVLVPYDPKRDGVIHRSN